MKKSIFLLLMSFIMMASTSCENHQTAYDNGWTEEDSAVVQNLIAQQTSPTFETADEIIMFQNDSKNVDEEKVIFYSMSPQMIDRVAKVAFAKTDTKFITIHDIVSEYIANFDVYSNLVDRGEKKPDPGIAVGIPHEHQQDTKDTTSTQITNLIK